MNEDMMTEAERASKLAEPATEDTATRGKGVFYVHTLGCQMNVHDSERIAGVLEADGYVPATEEQYLDHDVDLIVMNTCAVRENAAERCTAPSVCGLKGSDSARTCRSQSADAWHSSTVRRSQKRPLGSMPCSVPRTLVPCLSCLTKRASNHAQVKVKEELNYFPSQLPTDRASKVSSWVPSPWDAQHLHVLHRAYHPRQGT